MRSSHSHGATQAAAQRTNSPALLASTFLEREPGGEPVSGSQDLATAMVETKWLPSETIHLPSWEAPSTSVSQEETQ
mgnify:CR=1 FL=1